MKTSFYFRFPHILHVDKIDNLAQVFGIVILVVMSGVIGSSMDFRGYQNQQLNYKSS